MVASFVAAESIWFYRFVIAARFIVIALRWEVFASFAGCKLETFELLTALKALRFQNVVLVIHQRDKIDLTLGFFVDYTVFTVEFFSSTYALAAICRDKNAN